jgi:hypothetical protein
VTINFIPDTDAAPMTHARERLAYLLKAKEAAAAEVKEAQARISRLQALASAADPVKAKLAALDAEEAQRFATWARESDSSPVPAAETAARTSLLRELSEAQATADGASRAISGMSHEIAEAHAKVQAAESHIPVAAATAALEELGPIAESARAAVRQVAELRMKGKAILDSLLSASKAAGVTDAEQSEFMRAWAPACDALKGAFDLPHPDTDAEAAFGQKVFALLVELRTDASAKLGPVAFAVKPGTDTYATSPIVPMARLDAVSAAAMRDFRPWGSN